MDLTTTRVRYLTAIGAMLPTLAASACKEPQSSTVTADSATSTPATATAASAATPATPATAVPPTAEPGTPPSGFRMPTCPNGVFCSTEPAKLDPKNAAPAPYAKCSADGSHPDDKADAGNSFLGQRRVSFDPTGTAAERAKTPKACCYTWVIPCPGGRAFRDATGTPSVARTITRDDWTAFLSALAVEDLSPSERAALAQHWTDEAAFEHASIASFAQLTLDLLAVGAPPELLAATQRAALDEIQHARIAFALASAYGGAAPVGPAALAALPGANRTLAEIARLTFIDACVGESVASAVLAENARQASDPVLGDALASMAEDEERHAELAWRIVAWALRSGGPDVKAAVSAAQADVIDELVAISGDALSLRGNELRATVLREVVLPCSVALLASGSDTGQGALVAAYGPQLRGQS